jgi:hypothetical protein
MPGSWRSDFRDRFQPAFVGNGKIKFSLNPTGLKRDPKLVFSNKRFLKYPLVHQAAFF